MITGAGTLLYHKDVLGDYHILVGRESRYLQDYIQTIPVIDPDTGLLFVSLSFSYYQSAYVNTIEEAMALFDWRARCLSESLNQHIRYDKPIFVPDAYAYRTHFRICNSKNIGICKGRTEVYDIDLFSTALREMTEETGAIIQNPNVTGIYTHKMRHITQTIYMIELSEPQLKDVMTSIHVRNSDYYGEIFDLQFVCLKGSYKKNMNFLTKRAVNDLLRVTRCGQNTGFAHL